VIRITGAFKIIHKLRWKWSTVALCYSYYNTKQCAHIMAKFEMLNYTFILRFSLFFGGKVNCNKMAF